MRWQQISSLSRLLHPLLVLIVLPLRALLQSTTLLVQVMPISHRLPGASGYLLLVENIWHLVPGTAAAMAPLYNSVGRRQPIIPALRTAVRTLPHYCRLVPLVPSIVPFTSTYQVPGYFIYDVRVPSLCRSSATTELVNLSSYIPVCRMKNQHGRGLDFDRQK